MKLLIGVLLIIHGLIVAAISAGSMNPSSGLQNPSWLGWWPTNLGQSWLLSSTGLESSHIVIRFLNLFTLAGGIALVAAGLGVLGFLIPAGWWPALAVAGAAISLCFLVIYLHPLYAIGISLNVAILVALVWAHWPPELISF